MTKSKILILPVVPQENWASIANYYNGLHNADFNQSKLVFEKAPNFIPASIKPLNKLVKNLNKYIIYPIFVIFSNADIYHIVDHTYLYLALFIPRKAKIILTTHVPIQKISNSSYTYSSSLFPALSRMIHQYFLQQIRKVDYVICVSKYVEENLPPEYQGQRAVIHMPIHQFYLEENVTNDDVGNFIHQYNLPQKLVVCHVGRNDWPQKNVELIFRAMYILKKKGVSITLLKAGSKFSRLQEKMIKSLSLEENILHLGFLNPKQLILVYKASKALVFPSKFEGYCSPPLEALAVGTPVIVSNCKPMDEVVGRYGIQVKHDSPCDLALKLVYLLFNSRYVRLKELAKASQIKVNKDTWANIIRKTASIYKRVSNL